MDRKILLIYTGGTIGMKQDPETLLLKPFNFSQILEEVPELRKFDFHIDTLSTDRLQWSFAYRDGHRDTWEFNRQEK